MSDSILNVATVQPHYPLDMSREAHEKTFKNGLNILVQAAEKGCDYICLPEYFNCIGMPTDEIAHAVRNADAVKERIASIAIKYKTAILLPVVEERGDCLYNACHLIDAEGRIVFTYDKTHITRSEKDVKGITPGNLIKLYDSPHGRIGIVICYDIYFPEIFAVLRNRGARIIFFPSLQRSDNPAAVSAMLATRAMDSCAYVVRSSYGTPTGSAWKSGMPYGLSCIVHPDGTILASAGRYEGFAMTRVDLSREWERCRCYGYPEEPVRKFITEDRRKDLYGELAEE